MPSERANPCEWVPIPRRPTCDAQLSVLNKWVRPRWERYRVRDFDNPVMRTAIEDWLQSLWRSQQNPKGLAPKTVRSIYTVMKLAFKFGVK